MKVQIIIGATRTGRVSDRVAKWVASTATDLEGVELETVDLIDYPMPFFDEPISPQYNPDRHPAPEVQKWLDKVAEADAYIIVTPEYNRALPAVLKNAFEYVDFQMAQKPLLLIAHGSTGGAQAVAGARITLVSTLGVIIPQSVFLSARAGEVIDVEGKMNEELVAQPYGPQTNLQAALDSLKWYGDALTTARQA